ncbi:MAG: PHP domain-containing protein [Clostridia bacterium]|nr:PHP domain-containing protein [Clostridia bacterium]
MRVDLHLHSLKSDGSLPPFKVVDRVKSAGINFCALTDHDNVDGVKEAVERGRQIGVKVLRGVELSTYDYDSEFHVLGYGMTLNKRFYDGLREALAMREHRNRLIFQKLRQLGIEVYEEELRSFEGVKGRAHIAKLMVKKGYCKSINEVFDKWIGHNGEAYVRAERIKPVQAIELINSCHGVAVLAHPSRFRDENDFEEKFKILVDAGLGGVEAYYPSHTVEDRLEYAGLAKKYGIIATGGSDFHTDAGGNKIGQGEVELNEESIEYLLKINDRRIKI